MFMPTNRFTICKPDKTIDNLCLEFTRISSQKAMPEGHARKFSSELVVIEILQKKSLLAKFLVSLSIQV